MEKTEVKQILEHDFPQLSVEQIDEMPHGWRNYVFLINNKLIVRFPKQFISGVSRQKQILDRLSREITYKLPTIHYLDPERCYTVYPAILACSYTRWDFEQFNLDQQNRVAKDIADFLSQLHGAYALSELKSLEMARFDYQKEMNDIAEESQKFRQLDVPKKLQNFVLAQADVSREHLKKDYEEVLLHNDLHARNIIIDCDDKGLHGVIDFDDMKIGHFHLEFASLVFSLPLSISKKIIQQYSDQTGRTTSFDYALAIAVDYVSSNLIKFPDNQTLWRDSLETLEYLSQSPLG